jgi:Arc/MetJ family transcription regulator
MRTNIEIDNELLSFVMEHGNLKTKKEAVDFALRMCKQMLAQRKILDMLGKVEWSGNLEEMRTDRFQ